MKKSAVLLATTLKYDVLSKLCISNYKYIAYTNNIDYNHKKMYTLSNILNTEYASTICMNHFSIFVSSHLNDLLKLLTNKINIILPKDINAPLDMLPFYIRNCTWSNNFINLYIKSKSHNLQHFIREYQYTTNNSILYTDLICRAKKSIASKAIIEQYAGLPAHESIVFIQNHNLKLGII